MVEAGTRLAPRHLDQLRRSCGDVITPDDDGYDEARRLWNAIHDRRPSVIARPRNAQEVAAAVALRSRARPRDRGPVRRPRAHAGLTGPDGCLVIDLSNMRGVEVDPRTRIARANGGAFLGELDIAAQAHGLVCPVGVVGHTGVAGLTLGGGVGRLQRHFGLTIDNLAAVELVTADGRLVRATETDEPELFWGLRGAGWNFGIATAFEFRLQPFGPDLHRGVLTFPADPGPGDLEHLPRLRAARARCGLSLIFGIDRAGEGEGYPDDVVGRPIVYIAWNHSGSADDVERDTAGLRVGPEPLDDDDRQRTVPRGPDRPRPRVLLGQPLVHQEPQRERRPAGGARRAGRARRDRAGGRELLDHGARRRDRPRPRGRDRVCRPGRRRSTSAPDSSWTDAAYDEANIDWCRRAMAVVEPDRALGAYANGNADAGPEETRRIFGDAKLARLAALKRAWDPDNVFHVNPNVAPAPA